MFVVKCPEATIVCTRLFSRGGTFLFFTPEQVRASVCLFVCRITQIVTDSDEILIRGEIWSTVLMIKIWCPKVKGQGSLKGLKARFLAVTTDRIDIWRSDVLFYNSPGTNGNFWDF